MLEFNTIQILKPNTEILEIINDYKYKIKNGKIKNLLHTNLQGMSRKMCKLFEIS